MEADLIIKIVMGLIVILAILIILLFFITGERSKESAQKKSTSKKESVKEDMDLYKLLGIIKNKRSDSQKLSEALRLVIKQYGKVHKKLGLRPHPDFDIYADMLFSICRHPNATKEIILEFDRELSRLNPEYKKEINEAIAKGLGSRGI